MKHLGSKIIGYLCFLFKSVLANMFLSYLIPIINIIIICLLDTQSNNRNILTMSVINILIATNACYIASISSYYKINEKYNQIANYIKTFGLVISTVTFAISTYELQKNSFNISPIVYEGCAIITSILCVLLTIYAKLENLEIEKIVRKNEIENAYKIIEHSKETKSYNVNGNNYEV